MSESTHSEINVDRVMHEIREAVARQKRNLGKEVYPSSIEYSLVGEATPTNGFSRLSLQPEFQPRADKRYHVNDLLKYHGADFVRNAYRALLRRDPDPRGWESYVESLASGRLNKIDVLASLHFSAEGQQARVTLEGLAWPIAIRRLGRLPLIGYLVQLMIAMARLPLILRHQRQSEVYLVGQQQRIVDHSNQISGQFEAALAQLRTQDVAGAEMADVQKEALESLRQEQQAFETRLTAIREHLHQSAGALKHLMEQQTQELLSRQQHLAQEFIEQLARQRVELLEQQQQLTQQLTEQKEKQAQEDQRQQQLKQQVATQKQDLLQQHQLMQEIKVQARQFLGRQQQTQTELAMQERRLTLLLEAARAQPLGAVDQTLSQAMSIEEDHLLDALYASFEDQFRGDREEIKERLRVYLPILKDAKVVEGVLDIGSGRGEWLEILKGEGVSARGVDHNRVFVEQCRQSGLDVVEQDAINYLRSLPDNSLSAVSSFHLVEHLQFEVLIKLLDEIVRTLRPGGLLILETPNPENFIVGSCSFYADPTHRNPIPSQTLEFLLESRGLGRIKVMKLRPWDAAKIEGKSEIIKRFNEYFYGAPDYGIVGWKI